jgi:hypothetical protein
VGVVPRQFLRAFVTQLDLVEEHGDYDPMTEYGFEARELTVEEQQALQGERPGIADEAEESVLVPMEDVW